MRLQCHIEIEWYEVGTLAVDGWAVTFGTTMRGLGGAVARPDLSRCTKCDNPLINGQCTSRRIAVVRCPLLCGFNVPINGLIKHTA